MAKTNRKRRKARRTGPARIECVREPNGRASRRKAHINQRDVKAAEEAKAVAVEARVRLFGISKEEAGQNVVGEPNVSTVHGRMCRAGFKGAGINRDQWDAAEWYLDRRAAWLRSIQASEQDSVNILGRISVPGKPDERDKVQDDAGTRVAPTEDQYAAWCRSTRETWSAIQRVIQDESTQHRSPLASALDVILVRQQYVEHMVGDLRIVLSAIHRRFLAGERKKAA